MQKKKCMNNSTKSLNVTLLLAQFFLIIFVYHLLKDLKDTVVITASDAGAEVIPFIKIWGMLPISLLVSYCFAKLYHHIGRERTLYVFLGILLSNYLLFAFVLYPLREHLFLNHLTESLKIVLPAGCKGFIAMIGYWFYTLFYVSAELWSIIMLAILFWGYVNETTSLKSATQFYPLCTFVGNFAGILSGQVSHYLSHSLSAILSWQQTLQIIIGLVAICSLFILAISRWLSLNGTGEIALRQKKAQFSFQECLTTIFRSKKLFCIALIVVGYAMATNLIEVVWKESIRSIHPTPQAYNAYVNQLTSLIGILAVTMALFSHWIFKALPWSKVALITPSALFLTGGLFFALFHSPAFLLDSISRYMDISTGYLIMTAGACYYVVSTTSKYTLFDISKEMAFLSIEKDQRMKAKAVIDSVGSRLGKSGASVLTQGILLVFGSLMSNVSIIGIVAIGMIGVSIMAAKQLGRPEPTKAVATDIF